jgi:putative CocE/NonD family hydrolase
MPRQRTGSDYAVEVVRGIRIPTGDPQITLAADLYRPAVNVPVPVLLSVTPYRRDYIGGAAHDVPARWFAQRGYASLLVDVAGTGSSDGLRRPEFHPGEADDAISAMEWATRQPWCDGKVGMWGHSYGAVITLRAASRRPPQLQAIIPLMHGLNPGTDTVHPDGARGDLHALANRGTSMLVGQLLPPLDDNASPVEQRRWWRRLSEAEPVVLDFARNGPTNPAWRDRAIDGEAITVPAMCVGGWRDMFPDALIGVYERLGGPKKLIVGPWGHVLPQYAAVEPIDFLSVALRWWDQWLRDQDTGIMDESPVTLYQDGERPRWCAYQSWPPADDRLVLTTGDDTTLRLPEQSRVPTGQPIAEYRPDPTVGALRGLPGLGLGEHLRPVDQHDDDMRSVIATSEPLPADLIIAGRPEVLVTQSGDRYGGRLTVRLTEVDADGRSTFITAGVINPEPATSRQRIPLRPIVYRVRAGRRLRVALSDSDFPRLTPPASPVAFAISGIELTLPAATPGLGRPVTMPRIGVDAAESPAVGGDAAWTLQRDLVSEGIEVKVLTSASGMTTGPGHRYRIRSELRAAVRRGVPESAVTTGTHTASVSLQSGKTVAAAADVRATHEALWVHGNVTIDDVIVFSRTWTMPLEPDTQAACPPAGASLGR